MAFDLATGEYIKQLRRAGARPNQHLVRHILQAGAAALRPLLALALDTDLLHEDEPQCFAPIHALRLLGELRSTEIITPLLKVFPIEQDYPDEQLPLLWADEAAQMIGRVGAAAVEPLWTIADDPSWNRASRSVALTALTYVTIVAPETRDAVVASLLERLPASDDTLITANLVAALARLGVAEAYGQVMELYRQGRVDQSAIPAGMARQLLLTAESPERLKCVLHPLEERYDAHGPHVEQREA